MKKVKRERQVRSDQKISEHYYAGKRARKERKYQDRYYGLDD